jgi:hypothetical protein
MVMYSEINRLREEVLSAVQDAATRGNVDRVVELSRTLEDIEKDVRLTEELADRIARYRVRLHGPTNSEATLTRGTHEDSFLGATRPPVTVAIREGLSPREQGKIWRQDFARRRNLVLEKGTIYRSPSGLRVGVATASEGARGNWFLGLPDHSPDCVTLLCHSGANAHEFVLPSAIVQQVWQRLSRSGRYVKFNVFRRNGGFQLQIPGNSPVALDAYLDGPLV